MHKIDFDIVRGAASSKIGGRSENQDHFAFGLTALGPLIVVCDGMGGGPGGATASTLATDTIMAAVNAAPADADREDTLRRAITSANEELRHTISEHPHLQGMGTTCVCALLAPGTAYIAHVGDSRCYVLRDGRIRFRTRDHSQVGQLVSAGRMTEEQARVSPFSNVITRAIGIAPSVEPEIDKVSIRRGDRLALMSDGIWGTMPQTALVAELSLSTAEKVVATLPERVDAAGRHKGGGHDNLTLAAVDITAPAKGSAPSTGTWLSWLKRPAVIAFTATAVFGALIVWFLLNSPTPEHDGATDNTPATVTTRREASPAKSTATPAPQPTKPAPAQTSPQDASAEFNSARTQSQLIADIRINKEAAIKTIGELIGKPIPVSKKAKKKIQSAKANALGKINAAMATLQKIADCPDKEASQKAREVINFMSDKKNKAQMTDVDKNLKVKADGLKLLKKCMTMIERI